MADDNAQYLGDAVYASFDGYQIWLETRDGGRMRIALEPNTYESLVRYACLVWHPQLTRDAVEK